MPAPAVLAPHICVQSTHICAMPQAILHGPCQVGQHAPLAVELQEPALVPDSLP
jgi:hypothetical protein